ncbi:hypothetical protein [Pseudidiomarina taiwanensis]|uniref:Uncharacterized protein n=1 Tax=Pseudidiomarina taiwanensis TaxID=337250 RepID=A0A432ZL57_9GAMM|nr:hypothetical protein [Pseudidiomarina taiwanensis]RUO78708.1 hypothetical protein CWI83_06735 [Pseudidiomarina taiwanensis]
MSSLIKITFVSFILISAGCVMAEHYKRTSELLPEAPPRITIAGDNSVVRSKDSNTSGEFSKLTVTPRVIGDEYWKPSGLHEAALELSKMLPSEFMRRFSKYYGLKEKQEALDGYSQDDGIEQRLYDLDQYLISIWELDSNSNLARQFQCMGIFERDLHRFYVLWAGMQSEENNLPIDAEVWAEYLNLKQHIENKCNN